jgi:hypothetical protein
MTKNDVKPHKPLRQLAMEKTHGEGANPSLLGDPISLAAEATPDDNSDGATNQEASPTPDQAAKAGVPSDETRSRNSRTREDPVDHDNGPSSPSRDAAKARASKL